MGHGSSLLCSQEPIAFINNMKMFDTLNNSEFIMITSELTELFKYFTSNVGETVRWKLFYSSTNYANFKTPTQFLFSDGRTVTEN
jgi:hypothetical protein